MDIQKIGAEFNQAALSHQDKSIEPLGLGKHNSLFVVNKVPGLSLNLINDLIGTVRADSTSEKYCKSDNGVKTYGEKEISLLGKTQHYKCLYECKNSETNQTDKVWGSHSTFFPLSWDKESTPGVKCEGTTYKLRSLNRAPWSIEELDRTNAFPAKGSGIPEVERWADKQ
ncbi:MAG: hypothetical protein R3F02_15770 [Thiolinea sp.]